MKSLSIMLFTSSLMIMGCSNTSDGNNTASSEEVLSVDEHFSHKVSQLISQLTDTERFNYTEESTAFTPMVWTDSLTIHNEKRANVTLAHQISSNLKTELVKRGGKVVEHKSAQAISMTDDASYFLTRNLNELKHDIDVSYILAGTMLEIKSGIEVNVEVIDIDTHLVVSSASTFIDNKYLPELNKVFIQDGKIYRE